MASKDDIDIPDDYIRLQKVHWNQDETVDVPSNHKNFPILMHRQTHKLYFLKYYTSSRNIQLSGDYKLLVELSIDRPRYFPFLVKVTFSEKNCCMYMPYYRKGDLKKLLINKPEKYNTPSFKTKIAYQTAIALDTLHTRYRCVHYDLKPDNILIDENDDAVLTDFGIVQEIEIYDNSEEKTFKRIDLQTRTSLSYLYAEPNRENEIVNESTDIYSYGRLLMFMCGLDLSKPLEEQETSSINETIFKLIIQCLGERKKRPSALDIMRKFERREIFFGSITDLPVQIINKKFHPKSPE